MPNFRSIVSNALNFSAQYFFGLANSFEFVLLTKSFDEMKRFSFSEHSQNIWAQLKSSSVNQLIKFPKEKASSFQLQKLTSSAHVRIHCVCLTHSFRSEYFKPSIYVLKFHLFSFPFSCSL